MTQEKKTAKALLFCLHHQSKWKCRPTQRQKMQLKNEIEVILICELLLRHTHCAVEKINIVMQRSHSV